MASLAASLFLPKSAALGGLVPLHSADGPTRDHHLLEHLAETLPAQGIAVLTYDRRPEPDGADVPLAMQANDAGTAIDTLRPRVDSADLRSRCGAPAKEPGRPRSPFSVLTSAA